MNLEKQLFSTPAAKHWKLIGVKAHHGVCLPLFSLRSEGGGGIGEYLDLLPLILWLKSIGFDTLQLLPINDTGSLRSPYSPVSVFALNPIYLSLHRLPNGEGTEKRKGILLHLRMLNELPYVDYFHVFRLKQEFLDDYFFSEWGRFCEREDFQNFLRSNPWLKPYALYKELSILPGNPVGFSLRLFDKMCERYLNAMEKYYLIQFLCFEQMRAVKKFAEENEVFIKGDIPILLSKESADVWAGGNFFQLDYSAGAPPDYYNPDGQDWGFPLYNWNAMEADCYSWWKQRLRIAEQYFHMYRLDHVVGFYRIWASWEKEGQVNHGFIPENPSVWIAHGEKILKELLNDSRMLPIGEDLGTVPDAVRRSLRVMGICGTRVPRWERDKEDLRKYIPFDQYDPVSLTTVSTHDSETLGSWWRTHREDAERFAAFMGWEYQEKLSVERRFQILKGCHETPSIFHINLIQEYLAFVESLGGRDDSEERINMPGKNLGRNWTYRMRPTMDQVIADRDLESAMKALVLS